MFLLATNAFPLQPILSKGNGTIVIVTVYKDASVKEVRETREFIILGSLNYQLGDMAITCYSTLLYKWDRKTAQRLWVIKMSILLPL